jgi:hypothetical protein
VKLQSREVKSWEQIHGGRGRVEYGCFYLILLEMLLEESHHGKVS